MSADRAALVRRAYEEWNAGGVPAFFAWMAEAIELRDPPQLPDAGDWRGRAEVTRRLDEVATAVGGSSVELRDVRVLGNEVLVVMDWQRQGTGGSASLGAVYHLVRLTGDRIDRVRVFLTEEDALDADAS